MDALVLAAARASTVDAAAYFDLPRGASINRLARLLRSPAQFLRRRRLDNARDALRRGDGPVAEVALACGFRHPGRFACHYRARFGERPSDTLRRPQEGMIMAPPTRPARLPFLGHQP